MCDRFDAAKIEAVFGKWLGRLPHPFTARDRKAGYHYDLSILQAEFSLTMVMDRAVMGRVFFEEVIRENLDVGRPDHVQMIFDRRIIRKTPGRFRTRVITEGVIPSLHVDYKSARIKEYYKEGRAFAWRPPSTMPVPPESAGDCTTSPNCGRSASPPTDAFSTSKTSVTTVP